MSTELTDAAIEQKLESHGLHVPHFTTSRNKMLSAVRAAIAADRALQGVTVAYCNTGWAAPGWAFQKTTNIAMTTTNVSALLIALKTVMDNKAVGHKCTPDQRAAYLFSARPAPCFGACGCLGPQHIKNTIARYPKCPCGMQYVEQVDNCFYQISPVRPFAKEFEVTLLGPIGGPYAV